MKDEMIDTFNINLIGTGILAAGMTAILTVIVPEHGNIVAALEDTITISSVMAH